jgi:signal transduction histidine kinase
LVNVRFTPRAFDINQSSDQPGGLTTRIRSDGVPPVVLIQCAISPMITRPESNSADSADTWLVNLPPTAQQSRIALAVAVLLLVGMGATALFADAPLPRIDAFIPAIEVAVLLTGLFTAVLLFSKCWIHHSRALLALASGYLFTALIVVPHLLTFPGAFSPTGLLGAGLQSTGWLYIFWHAGLPVALLIYAFNKDEKLTEPITQSSTLFAVGCSVAIVVSLVCGLTLLATTGERFLPRVFLDSTHIAPLTHYVVGFEVLISVVVLAMLWGQQRSVLDQWLMVVTLAFLSELVINGLLISARFTLGFYASRIFSVVTSTIVLVVLLDETVRLYGRLARSNAMLRHEQNNKLMNLEALAASISHQVRQPLTAIVAGGSAQLRYLGHTPPKLEKVRSTGEGMIAAAHRASQILDDVRNLFGTAERAQVSVDVNDLALSALRALDSELKNGKITTRIKLKAELPPVMGHNGQLQEVIINLMQNAIDAMDTVDDDRRVLQVRTEHNGGDAISVEIEDTGPGIDPKKSADIFDAFFTTKPHGMGLGLAICRMIIERHEGQLSVSSANPHGAVFRIKLPQIKLPH